MNGTIRSRLTGALLVTDNDLTTVANRLAGPTGAGGAMELNLSRLTQLYRLTKLAAALQMNIDELLQLLDLVALPAAESSRQATPSSASEVLSILDQANWLATAGFTIYELAYLITGVMNEFVNPGYTTASIKTFVENLAVSAENARIAAGQLVFENVNTGLAGPVFLQLQAHRFVTGAGIAFGKRLDYESLLSIGAVTDLSLVTDDIDEEAAKGVFSLLRSNGIISQDGYISPAFGSQTDFSFLFQGDPDAEIKRGEVRGRLLQIQGLALALRPDSFVSDALDAAASAAAFAALNAHGVIDNHGGLSQSFDAATDLGYLFAGDPRAELKRGQVRLVLLQRESSSTRLRSSTLNAALKTNSLLPDSLNIWAQAFL
jgi:hypothetical protein